MKAGFKTFADQLIVDGFKMSPETTIVDAKPVFDQHFNDPEILGFAYERCLPPFNHCFVEFDRDIDDADGAYCVWDVDARILAVQPVKWHDYSDLIIKPVEYITPHSRIPAVSFQEDGTWSGKIEFSNPIFEFCPVSISNQQKVDTRATDDYRTLILEVLSVFGLIHKRAEVQLIKYSRQVRRQLERKTGKKPSPYYVIGTLFIKPGQRRRTYPLKHPVGDPRDLREHLVRGHFRINTPDHKLPQMAGKTFWIPAHTRGSNENGVKEKIYKIVMPDAAKP